MDKLKQWVVLTLVACMAIVAAGWFLVVSPKRSEAAELRGQAADKRSANARLENELQVLKAQAKELPTEQAKLAAVAAKIPDNPALPGLIRNLIEAADGAGVELVSITPGEPVQPEPVAAAPVAPPNAQQGPTTPGSAAPAAGPAGQLVSIPQAVDVVGDYFEVQLFLAAVEDLTRAVRVDNLTVVPGISPTAKASAGTKPDDGRTLTATVSGHIYMAANRPAPLAATVPDAEGVSAGAAAAAPAPPADAAE